MANECKVFEFADPRSLSAPVPPMPPLAYGTLSTGGSRTLNKSTTVIGIQSTLAGTVDFTTTAGVAPDGTKSPVLIQANAAMVHYGVRGGTAIRFD